MPPPTAHMGIYIDRPAQDVFNFVMDLGRTPEWRPRMSGAEWITPGPPGVGSKFRVSAKALLYTFNFELEVTEWDPPRYFAYVGKQGPVSIKSFMEWLPDGAGSRFFLGGEPEANNWLVKILRPAFEYALLKQNLADLDRLKTIMESSKDKKSVV
ncbi:MAG: hypothetical protein HKN91_02635 [Acidimicrobiia bacterium]|nr:hypothetical protein [Acidimicrobiia bacterium]